MKIKQLMKFIMLSACFFAVHSTHALQQEISSDLQGKVTYILEQLDTATSIDTALQKKAYDLIDELYRIGAYNEIQRIEKRLKQFAAPIQQEPKYFSETLSEIEHLPEKSNFTNVLTERDNDEKEKLPEIKTTQTGNTVAQQTATNITTQTMQNLLNYIQTHGKPAAQKTIDWLLLNPRIIQTWLHRAPRTLSEVPNMLNWWAIPTVQAFAPGIFLLGRNYFDAIFDNNIGLVRSLIVAGENVNQKGVLTSAVYNNRPEIIKLLLQAGANVNEQNGKPLRAATEPAHINPEIAKLLLQAGANFTLTNEAGETAEDLAQLSPGDTPQIHQKKLAIQKLFNFYKAKRNLAPQIQDLLHKKAAAKIVQEEIEQVTGSGAQDIAGIIKGYL